MTRRSCSSSSTSSTLRPPAAGSDAAPGAPGSSSSSMSIVKSSDGAAAVGVRGRGGAPAGPRPARCGAAAAPERADSAGAGWAPSMRHVGDPEQLLHRGLAREDVTQARSPTATACRRARAASAICSAVAPSPIRRSISGFIVSTSMMLNRPRYPVMRALAAADRLKSGVPGGMKRATALGQRLGGRLAAGGDRAGA